MESRGRLIVLDGNDGSGKATQARLLQERLTREGTAAECVDFPAYGRNLFGSLVGECLAGTRGDFLNLDPRIASTLYAADRFESSAAIRALLETGTTVIADRFSSANAIHQGGKIPDEGERIAFLSWLDRMEHGVLGVPRPDLVIYLEVPVEASLLLLAEKRRAKIPGMADGQSDQVESDRAYLERSHATAKWLAEREGNWHAISCADPAGAVRSRESIHEEIFEILSADLSKR